MSRAIRLPAGVRGQSGFASAFAFPILVDEKSAGVMEFYNREIREPDASLLQSLRSIGSQIGLFHGRKQMEARQAMENSVMHLLARSGSPEKAMVKIIQPFVNPGTGLWRLHGCDPESECDCRRGGDRCADWFFQEHQCNEMQCYYFSKLIPGDEFAQLLRAKKALVRENASE